MIWKLWIGLLVLMGFMGLTGCEPQTPEGPLNVLFITVDDLNTWVGCMGGHPNALTPSIDRLAEHGILFERAYCPAPLCNPSRTAIMMGVSPATTGIYDNETWFRDLPRYENWVTLPQYFQKHGYTTVAGGKLFHSPKGKMSDPNSWDEVLHTKIGTPYPSPLEQYGHGLRSALGDSYLSRALDWGPLDVNDEDCQDWQTADKVADFLKGTHEKPFFLACGIFRPHLRWYAPKTYFDMHPIEDIFLPPFKEDDLKDVPQAGRNFVGGAFPVIKEHGQWREAVRAYLACSSFADACVGHVLEALLDSAYKNNTIVVLCGDHGWNLGEKSHWGKSGLWEATTRTPLIVYVPGMTKKAKRCQHPVNLLDLHKTLVELCGLPEREDIEGHSLVPLIRKPTRKWEHPTVTTHGEKNHAVRDKRFRYIRYANGEEELYDHERDPNEWTNLAYRRELVHVKIGLKEALPKKKKLEDDE